MNVSISVFTPDRFTPWERTSGRRTHWIGGRVGPRAAMESHCSCRSAMKPWSSTL